jgi:uncharacterized membrane protein
MNYFFSATFIKISLVSAVIFIILDLLWLAVVANKIYFNSLGYLAEIKDGKIVFNLKAGITVQVIIAVGLVFFISMALQLNNTLMTSMTVGAISGFVLYATYDMTNLSFIKGYTLSITLIDMAWGTAQGFFAGIYVYFLTKFF